MEFSKYMNEHLEVAQKMSQIENQIEEARTIISSCIESGGKILIAGNGGSAADSQHFAAELMVKYKIERIALPAIALTTDTSILTAHANDFEFSSIFERQVQALGKANDTLIAISTSGNSQNILQAIDAAKQKEMNVIALSGNDGGKMKNLIPEAIVIPSKVTSYIQEMHICILHYFCETFENN